MRRLPALALLLSGGALLTACTPLTAWSPPGPGSASSSPPGTTPQNGTEAAGTTCSGSRLNTNPVLATGQIIRLTADGFGAFVPVELRLMGQSTVPDQRYQADGTGVVRIRYEVPDVTAGKHLLAFSGNGPNTPSGTGPTASSDPAAGLALTVTVPNLRLFHFVDASDLPAKAC